MEKAAGRFEFNVVVGKCEWRSGVGVCERRFVWLLSVLWLVLKVVSPGQVGAHRCVLAAFCEGFRAEIVQAGMTSPSKKKSGASSGKTEIKLHSQKNLLTVASANALLHFM